MKQILSNPDGILPPPPWRGRTEEGGKAIGRRKGTPSCQSSAREACARTSRLRNGNSGRPFADARLPTSGSAARFPSVPTSPTSAVSSCGSSSRLMVVNMPGRQMQTNAGPDGSAIGALPSFDSGTTTCCRIPTACLPGYPTPVRPRSVWQDPGRSNRRSGALRHLHPLPDLPPSRGKEKSGATDTCYTLVTGQSHLNHRTWPSPASPLEGEVAAKRSKGGEPKAASLTTKHASAAPGHPIPPLPEQATEKCND